MSTPDIHLHIGDLPAGITFPGTIAVDTETTGLNLFRDRLCVVQLSAGDGTAHVVQIRPGVPAPNLAAVLGSNALKIMQYARFDLAFLRKGLGISAVPAYCTKIASRLARTNTDRHSLRTMCEDLLGVTISKQQQSSDWAAETLSADQVAYAATDVLHLHSLKAKLDTLLQREGRVGLAQACFDFLPHRAALDLAGFGSDDLFSH